MQSITVHLDTTSADLLMTVHSCNHMYITTSHSACSKHCELISSDTLTVYRCVECHLIIFDPKTCLSPPEQLLIVEVRRSMTQSAHYRQNRTAITCRCFVCLCDITIEVLLKCMSNPLQQSSFHSYTVSVSCIAPRQYTKLHLCSCIHFQLL